MPEKIFAVYMMTNPAHTVLYTGVTSDLAKRVWEHRNHCNPSSFTARYNAVELAWYETTNNMRAAIAREKQIKAGSRAKKVQLIEAINPQWADLGEHLIHQA